MAYTELRNEDYIENLFLKRFKSERWQNAIIFSILKSKDQFMDKFNNNNNTNVDNMEKTKEERRKKKNEVKHRPKKNKNTFTSLINRDNIIKKDQSYISSDIYNKKFLNKDTFTNFNQFRYTKQENKNNISKKTCLDKTQQGFDGNQEQTTTEKNKQNTRLNAKQPAVIHGHDNNNNTNFSDLRKMSLQLLYKKHCKKDFSELLSLQNILEYVIDNKTIVRNKQTKRRSAICEESHLDRDIILLILKHYKLEKTLSQYSL